MGVLRVVRRQPGQQVAEVPLRFRAVTGVRDTERVLDRRFPVLGIQHQRLREEARRLALLAACEVAFSPPDVEISEVLAPLGVLGLEADREKVELLGLIETPREEVGSRDVRGH